MNHKKSSGIGGLLGIVGVVALFLIVKNTLPSFGKILLTVGIILVAAVAALVVLLVYLTTKDYSGTAAKQETDQILSKGRKNLMELRRLAMRIQNSQVRSLNEEICKTVEKILRALKDQPEDIPEVRQFLNYYLPTLGSILTKFVKVEQSGVDTGNMVPNTLACLRDIKTAVEKQYANLFEDDLLDMSVEMEALSIACKRDGLLEDQQQDPEDGGIQLTL